MRVNLGKDTSGRPLIVDDTWLAKLRYAEKRLGFKFTIIQGSYRGTAGAKLSGGTHNAGGAGDLRTWDIPARLTMTRVLTELRRAGLIAWKRTIAQGFPDQEIHALDYGNPHLSPAARAQVVAWTKGLNGLAGPHRGPDDGPRVHIPKAVPTMTTYGADVSHYQLDDGLTVKMLHDQGYQFVIAKCTQGATYADPTYRRVAAQAKTEGVLFAAYHFLEHGNPAGQAAWLAGHIGDKTIPVMLDTEPSGKSRPTMSDVNAFTVAATKLGLNVTMDYLPAWYWDSLGRPSLQGRRLVASAYPSTRHDFGSRLYPGDNDPHWAAYGGQVPTLWQFTATGKVSGYNGDVDLDAYRGSLAQLRALRLFKDYGTPTPPPPPPPPAVAPIWNLQFNSQHTDTPSSQLLDTVRLADVAGLNEIESVWQRVQLKAMTRYGVYPTIGSAAAVPIVWNKKRFTLLDRGALKVVPGVKGLTPDRWIVWVYLLDTKTGKKFTRINTQAPHHIDVAGRARVNDQLPGQNDRARVLFAKLAETIAARAKFGPVVWGGDLNVDYLAEAKLAAGQRTPWFPYTVLSPVTRFSLLTAGTLGPRAIDWTGYTGQVTAGAPKILALGPSDHRGVLTSFTL